MDCFWDFCLACDGQTNGSAYCSQACQLTSLDNYGTSEPASPTYDNNLKTTTRRLTGSVGSGLYLPPAIDFSVYRVPSSGSISTIKGTRMSQGQLSEKAQNDLRDYVDAFDQTRTLKRRVSMQSNEDAKSTSSR